jgi:hypothetical protein
MLPFGSLLADPAKSSNLLAGSDLFTEPGELKIGPNIFQSIGVEPIINCRGTFTIIGGSIERVEVREAMEAASKILCSMMNWQMELENALPPLPVQNGYGVCGLCCRNEACYCSMYHRW